MLLTVLQAMFWLSYVEGFLQMEPDKSSLISLTESDTGVFGFDVLGPKYILKKTSISISCRMSDTSALNSPSIDWQKLGPTSDQNFTSESKLSSDNCSFVSTLTVKKPLPDSISAYLCVGKSGNQVVNATTAFLAWPLLYLEVVSEVGVVTLSSYMQANPDILVEPNVAMTVTCKIQGFPVGNATWLRIDASGKETQVETGPKLQFNKTSYATDRGFYICRSANSLGSNSLKIFFRVKSTTAYLVPLIITSCMAVVLAAVISVYELFQCKKQNQRLASSELSEQDDDDNKPVNV